MARGGYVKSKIRALARRTAPRRAKVSRNPKRRYAGLSIGDRPDLRQVLDDAGVKWTQIGGARGTMRIVVGPAKAGFALRIDHATRGARALSLAGYRAWSGLSQTVEGKPLAVIVVRGVEPKFNPRQNAGDWGAAFDELRRKYGGAKPPKRRNAGKRKVHLYVYPGTDWKRGALLCGAKSGLITYLPSDVTCPKCRAKLARQRRTAQLKKPNPFSYTSATLLPTTEEIYSPRRNAGKAKRVKAKRALRGR
jgi:hypothetical protein